MWKFVVTFSILLVSALAAPQLQGQQHQQQQQPQAQAQAYNSGNSAQQYHQQQGGQQQAGGANSNATPVPIISFDDSQPGDGTFKYRWGFISEKPQITTAVTN